MRWKYNFFKHLNTKASYWAERQLKALINGKIEKILNSNKEIERKYIRESEYYEKDIGKKDDEARSKDDKTIQAQYLASP